MIHLLFASESAEASTGIGALGISGGAFLIQFLTFVLVFMLLRKFAFKPVIKLLEERRRVIDDGVRMGEKLTKEQAKFDTQLAETMSKARAEADHIIDTGHKEAREIVREAEKTAQRKADSILADAEVRINEESEQAKRALEKDIVGLVSEATEAIVGEKVDAKKDAEIIDKIIKNRVAK
ncbi:MAG TPA: F0F1 ATP synthase subunit B [Candidatus Saccharimonadales bacterium]|nr:F0F1 ATP synthase subunit B [Candidatus Saccharimonadales bacterium]